MTHRSVIRVDHKEISLVIDNCGYVLRQPVEPADDGVRDELHRQIPKVMLNSEQKINRITAGPTLGSRARRVVRTASRPFAQILIMLTLNVAEFLVDVAVNHFHRRVAE